MSSVVGVGNETIKEANPPFTHSIEDIEGWAEKSGMIMSFLVEKHMSMSKEAKTRTNSEEMINDKPPHFKTVVDSADQKTTVSKISLSMSNTNVNGK